MSPSPEQLQRIRDLYTQGLCLQALEVARESGPLDEWEGPAARVMGGRLAANLGAPDLAQWLHLRAYRDDRQDPEATYYYARQLFQRRGPLRTWQFLRRRGDLAGAPVSVHAEWLAFHGFVCGALRDFQAADAFLSRAEALEPDNPWLWIERAEVLEFEDRYEESLAAARRALELRPWFRPAVQAASHTLQLLDRPDEALSLLEQAAARIENAPLVAQLVQLQKELELYPEAWTNLRRFEELAPLAEPDTQKWAAMVRCDLAYHLGREEEAIQAAEASGSRFFEAVARNLRSAPPGARRVQHPVRFVRQHRVTCGPATLTTLGRFWGEPVEHLAVVEEICYDGTSDHSERHWAETHGWTAREFRVDWDSARALLDRGAPFTFTTVEPGMGHLQAIIGYDERRGSFLVRDPYVRPTVEFLATETLQRYAPTGPRGMVMVPRELANLLEGLELPEAELYDRIYRLQRELVAHHRPQAEEACKELELLAPGHRLALHARRLLAVYDGDLTASAAAVERLLELFPSDANLKLSRLSHLRELARAEERLEMLEALCQDREAAGTAYPVYLQMLARERMEDARQLDRCERLLHRALAVTPGDAGCYHALAGVNWDQGRREEALELYRFAACLNDREEAFSRSYFTAARHLHQTESALRFLQDRFRRFGTRSSSPGITLHSALMQLDRTGEALAVLEEAMRLRPEDGELLLFGADAFGRVGRFERADALLELARTRSSSSAWKRQAASNALYTGESAAALQLWREVLEAEPLAMEAHTAAARLLAQMDGGEAVHAHFERYSERFPHSFALHQLWAEWAREEDDPTRSERIVRRLVEINPADGWARRELTSALSRQGRLEEAFEQAEVARQLAPHVPSFFNVYGDLCYHAGRWEEAAETFREGLRCSIDNSYALTQLLNLADSPGARREVLTFAAAELARQTTFGDGLIAFRALAAGVLEPDEILSTLRAALAARPDLWHAWAALTQQLTSLDRLDEALGIAREAAERFPLLPGSWLELATVYGLRGDRAAQRQALRKALEIAPDWSPAVRDLAAWLEREGDVEAQVRLMENTLPRDPLEVRNHGYLARALWEAGRKSEAVARLKQGLRIDPGFEWGWSRLAAWCTELNCPHEAADFARDLCRRRPHEARSWLVVAQVLDGEEELDEQLRALDRALELNPRLVEAYDRRIELLAAAGRHAEALESCRTFPGGELPTELKARLAWVEAQRGDLPAAIDRMKAVVAADPGHLWAWACLGEWYDVSGEDEAYLEVTSQLIRLAPHAGTSWGLHGDARHRTGDRPGAKAAWKRALELDPDYAFAGFSLLDAQLEDGDWAAVMATLEVLLKHGHQGWALERGIRVAIQRQDTGAAAHYLSRLCVEPKAAPALQAADSQLVHAGWGSVAEGVYSQMLSNPQILPEVAALWIECYVRRADWSCENWLPDLMRRGEPGVHALGALVSGAARLRQEDRLRALIRSHREALLAHTHTWAAVGEALNDIGDHKGCVEWMADWERREGLETWMLLIRVLALRYLGAVSQARAVGRAALELAPDAGTPSHQVWQALDELLERGSTEIDLGRIAPGDLTEYHQFLWSLALALQAAGSRTPEAFREARELVAAARKTQSRWRRDPLLREAFDRTMIRIAETSGTVPARLWGLTRFWRKVWG